MKAAEERINSTKLAVAQAEESYKDGGIRIGIDGCFTPPFNLDDMLKDINQDKPSDENIIKIRH